MNSRHLKHLAVAMEEMMVGVGLQKCQSWEETARAGRSRRAIEEMIGSSVYQRAVNTLESVFV